MYLLVENNKVKKYPYLYSNLKTDNPNISFPVYATDDLLARYNIFPVKLIDKPICDFITDSVEESIPIKINGEWTQVWKIVPVDAEEIVKRKKEIKNNLAQQIQIRLDNFAQTKNYDNILSAISYATSNVPEFQKDAQCAIEARDITWNKLFQIFSDVDNGKRIMPIDYSQIESELPILNWK